MTLSYSHFNILYYNQTLLTLTCHKYYIGCHKIGWSMLQNDTVISESTYFNVTHKLISESVLFYANNICFFYV